MSLDAEAAYLALKARDARFDGRLFVGVTSTGVYCRPSCAARPARPENVAFHLSQEEARAAGFRPCKRCKPDQASSAQQQAALVAEACRHIEQADTLPVLEEAFRPARMETHLIQRGLLPAPVFQSVA